MMSVQNLYFYSYYLNLIKQYRIKPMYEGNSQNNLLINKQTRQQQQYNFQQSFVMAPIKMQTTNFHPNLKSKQMNTVDKGTSLGMYEKYKLTELLGVGFTGVENNTNINLQARNHDGFKNGGIIEVVTIDADSNVACVGPKFVELMNKYAAYDVCFVTVAGQKGSGKSFFLDKVYNLCQVKGNNYSLSKAPGIYTYSVPFMKDGLCIFLLQLSGSEIQSDIFKIFNLVCVSLSSSFVYLSKDDTHKSQQDFIQFAQSMEMCLVGLQIQQKDRQSIKISNFYQISRSKPLKTRNNIQNDRLDFFLNKNVLYLPNAAADQFKDTAENLAKCSFLSKQCVNPQYIYALSQIFKHIYNQISQKRFHELIMNGNIANKLVQQFLQYLNSHKNIPLIQIYERLIKQLYISAYNYCVISYHDELQLYFDDQQPKNSDSMYEAFTKASENALAKFNQFNLDKNLHEEYLQKLYDHIEDKQRLLITINKQKTYDYLVERFSKICQDKDKGKVFVMLKNQRNDLDDGRAEALEKVLVSLLGNTPDYASLQKLKRLQQQKKSVLNQINTKVKKNKQEQEEYRKKLEQLDKIEQQLDKQIKKMISQKSIVQSKIDPAAVEKLKAKRDKLREKDIQTVNQYKAYQSQNQKQAIQQVCSGLKQKIDQKTKRVAQLTKELEQAQKPSQNPQSKSPAKPNMADNSKIKQSQIKKQSKK